jgi:hypothetical protein
MSPDLDHVIVILTHVTRPWSYYCHPDTCHLALIILSSWHVTWPWSYYCHPDTCYLTLIILSSWHMSPDLDHIIDSPHVTCPWSYYCHPDTCHLVLIMLFCFSGILHGYLVRKDIYVYVYIYIYCVLPKPGPEFSMSCHLKKNHNERLSNIRLKTQIKKRNSPFIAVLHFTVTVYVASPNNGHNSYPKMSVKRSLGYRRVVF